MIMTDQAKQNRIPRDMEDREQFVRPESWAPPDTLPTPTPQAGFEFRWIRTATLGIDDPSNVSAKRREGFEPVPASEQPHIASISDPRSQYKDCIEIGGLLLCKVPKEFMDARRKYYENMTHQAQVSVDNNLMREQDARMPLFKEGKTKVTFGNGGA
jgi:hypothetical protein